MTKRTGGLGDWFRAHPPKTLSFATVEEYEAYRAANPVKWDGNRGCYIPESDPLATKEQAMAEFEAALPTVEELMAFYAESDAEQEP
jgi:hypothetical protein